MRETVLHAFDPSEGSTRRVLVVGVPHRGSRRRAQPRTFTLAFKPPPAILRTQPAPPSEATPPSPAQLPLQRSPVAQSSNAAANTAADASPASTAKGSERTDFEPDLEDLVVLAFEAARAAEARRQAMQAAVAEAAEAAAIAHAATSAEEAALAATADANTNATPPELPAVATLTPGLCRTGAWLPRLWSAHATPARPHATPIEGVPERLTVRKPSASTPAAAAAGPGESCSTSCGLTPIEGVPERLLEAVNRPQPPEVQEGPVPSGTRSACPTPIEGVPERLAKRPRLSVLARPPGFLSRDAAEPGCGPEPLQPNAQPSLPGPLQQHDDAQDAACPALRLGEGAPTAVTGDADGCAFAEGAAGPVNPDGMFALTDKDATAAELAAADLTAADIAAAASAAARAALQRIRPFLDSMSPLAQALPATDAATSSHTCITTPGEPTTSSSSGTPAVVKMQNLAAAAASAVQRAAEAMGGPPSCLMLQRCQHSLPPRPPSASGQAPLAAPLGALGQGGGGEPAAAAAAAAPPRRMSCASDSGNNVEDLIHRAPPGTLIFPSRTPSPMGGFRWPSAPQGATPQFHAGAATNGMLVTPTLEAAAATLANGEANGAAGASAACAATPNPEGLPSGAAEGVLAGSRAAACATGDHQAGVRAPGLANGIAAAPPQDVDMAAHDDGYGTDAGDGGGWAPGAGDGDDAGGCYSEDEHGEGKAGISVLRQEDDNQDTDDEAAMQEVRALPEEPQAVRALSRDGARAAPLEAEQGRSLCTSGAARASGTGARASSNGGDSSGNDPAGSGNNAGAVSAANGASQGSGGDNGGRAASEEWVDGDGRKRAQRPGEGYAHERRLVANRKSLAGNGLVVDDLGTRRSTRNRVRPLQYWRGESKSYGRAHKSLPTVQAITVRTPEPKWPLPTDMHEKAKRKARAKQATQATAAAADA